MTKIRRRRLHIPIRQWSPIPHRNSSTVVGVTRRMDTLLTVSLLVYSILVVVVVIGRIPTLVTALMVVTNHHPLVPPPTHVVTSFRSTFLKVSLSHTRTISSTSSTTIPHVTRTTLGTTATTTPRMATRNSDIESSFSSTTMSSSSLSDLSTTIPLRDVYTNVAVLDPQWFDEYILQLLYHHSDSDASTTTNDDDIDVEHRMPLSYQDDMINVDFLHRVEQLRSREKKTNQKKNVMTVPERSVTAFDDIHTTTNENEDCVDADDDHDHESSPSSSPSSIVSSTTAPSDTAVTTNVMTVNGTNDDSMVRPTNIVTTTVTTTTNNTSLSNAVVPDDTQRPVTVIPSLLSTDTVLPLSSLRLVRTESISNMTAVHNSTSTNIPLTVTNTIQNDAVIYSDNVTEHPTLVAAVATPVTETTHTNTSTVPLSNNDDDDDQYQNDDEPDNMKVRNSSKHTNTIPDAESQQVILYYYSSNDKNEEEEDGRNVDNTSITRRAMSLSSFWKQVPLSVVQKLGYSASDVIQLLPMALHIIVTDQIRKPQRPIGIPSRWLRPSMVATNTLGITDDDDDDVNTIQIVHESQVDEILQIKMNSVKPTFKQRRSTELQPPVATEPPEDFPPTVSENSSPSSLLVDMSDSHNVTIPSYSSLQPQNTTNIKNVSSRTFVAGPDTMSSPPTTWNRDDIVTKTTATTPRERTPRRSSDRTNNDNEDVSLPSSTERRQRRPLQEPNEISPPSERTVYNGRTSTRPKRRDTNYSNDLPPSLPPKSGIWPDVDTFQKLLRDEATFRLRILGNDWTDIVKEEIDWRNDLYTNWLQTLQNGIGEPFVQSRSDRLRRQRRPSPPPQDPVRRNERTKSKSPRPK